ncbi:MAG: SH3 domain-containing protein [Fibromonadales bacterium]|nr:SH3 domain-containing protein [Fibromonadales bacterium]
MRNKLSIGSWILAVLFSVSANSQDLQSFSVMPPSISNISVQKNSEWEKLMVVLDFNIPRDVIPVITDSTVELSFFDAPNYSDLFRTVNSTFARGLDWNNGKLTVYLYRGRKPAVMIMENRLLLQHEIRLGRLENWQATSISVKSSNFFLPSYEPLAQNVADFARTIERRPMISPSLAQTIQVKRTDASYMVAEDVISVYPSTNEVRPIGALEFGDRLKVLDRRDPYYKIRHNEKEGYVFQRDVLLEAQFTTSQKDKLRRLKKDSPGGADSVAHKFGWRDSDRIVYSSYGSRDPFIEVKSFGGDGINIDNLILAGVVYENEMPMALFSDNKIKGQSYTLHEGDTINNGRVLKISRNDVLFLLQEYGVSRRYKMSLPDKFGGNK